MGEQKMPALPDADDFCCGELYWNQDSVERIRAEAVEFGRQQERERLEPLRMAVEGYMDDPSYYWRKLVLEAARTLLEQPE